MPSSGDDAAAKRQRVSRACDLCRRKKIKCDGAAPICSNCRAFSLECSYNDMTKKRGPPKGYIEAIENRLHKLEHLLGSMVKDGDPQSKSLLAELNSPLETANGERIKSRPVRRANHHDDHHQKQKPMAEETGLHDMHSISPHQSPMTSSPHCLPDSPSLGETVPDSPNSADSASDNNGQLSMDEAGQFRYLGKSSGFYLLQNSRTYQNGAFHFSGYGHKPKAPRRTLPLNPYELPPNDLSEHLIGLYFKYFYPFLPMFFKKRLTPVTINAKFEPLSPLLLNAIYAVASRVSPDERVRSDPASADTAGDIFFERAKCLLDDYYDTPRTSTVQALLLLASHQQGAMKSARAWIYSGMAFRMAQDLGLHRNCEHWDIPPEDRERRKRVFWCCFIVDRLTSAIYGRASSFEERDIDVPFPSVDDDEPIASDSDTSPTSSTAPKPPSVLETFLHVIKICDILGHVLKHIYYAKARLHGPNQHTDHILTALNGELTTWFNNLPAPLKYKPPNTQCGETGPDPALPICQMHMIYYTTVILLYRSFIPGPAHAKSRVSSPSYQICVFAANSILDIANIMLGENHLKYVCNYAVYFVFTAGIVFIKLASSADADKAFDAKVNINKIMRALDEIEVTWTNAARSCNILGELAGLRDIKLERDEYTAKNDRPPLAPPSIAVPNSPMERPQPQPGEPPRQPEYSAASAAPWSSSNAMSFPARMVGSASAIQNSPMFSSYMDTRSASSMMDPFAAPGTVLSSSGQPSFDPPGTAFWGVPSSLDDEEWSNYFGMQATTDPPPQPQAQSSLQQQQQQHQQQQPLIPSDHLSPLQFFRAPSFSQQPLPARQDMMSLPATTKNLIHADHNVDVLSGVSMPLGPMPEAPANSFLFGFLEPPSMGGARGSFSATTPKATTTSDADGSGMIY